MAVTVKETSYNIQTLEGVARFLIEIVSHSDNEDSVMENLRYVFDTCKQCNIGLTFAPPVEYVVLMSITWMI